MFVSIELPLHVYCFEFDDVVLLFQREVLDTVQCRLTRRASKNATKVPFQIGNGHYSSHHFHDQFCKSHSSYLNFGMLQHDSPPIPIRENHAADALR
jgi:hypothetical protein